MTAAAPVKAPRKLTKAEQRAVDAKTKLTSPWASGIAIVIALLWTIPTFGLFVTSFRPQRDIRTSGWWTFFSDPEVTLKNYDLALNSGSVPLSSTFINTIIITLPAVIIPITLALLAAYAFAWIEFRYKALLFVAVFALQVVPIQVTLVPLLTQYVNVGIDGTFWAVWLSHSIFALPLAIFLMHNFMKDIPASLIEAARVDGAGHVKIFFVVLLPLLVPAIASFAIFQFLWVWNDLLVALVFANDPSLNAWSAVAPAVRRSVHRDDRPDDRLPVAAAVLRPRPSGRWRQGLSRRTCHQHHHRCGAGGRGVGRHGLPRPSGA
jgi:alpha-glucoside transport system permease protein